MSNQAGTANTPNMMRKYVVLLGGTNAGKSTLFNRLTGQQNAIVSAQPGTTTDPVLKAMELIPYGPIVLVDTAGEGDDSMLGEQRQQKTRQVLRRADAVLYVADILRFSPERYSAFCEKHLPHLLVLTKRDTADEATIRARQRAYPEAILTSEQGDLAPLHTALSALLESQQEKEQPLIGDLVPAGGTVVLVTPIDDAAPKGRLILPQVQVLRDSLDHGIKAMVCREHELESALDSLKRIDLVVTDSQVFRYVDERLPRELPLTSFSMLLARQKGDFRQLLDGVHALDTLEDGDCILMLEGCTHNRTHEDIGYVKIPAMLQKKTGKQLRFEYCSGYDFPDDLTPYAAAIQCGGCMLTPREIASRLELMRRAGLAVSNYGIVIAWAQGILDRCTEVFIWTE